MRHAHSESHAPHRDKRPFQPSITSFFAPRDDDSGSDDDIHGAERGPGPLTRSCNNNQLRQHHARARGSAVPGVPAPVQADLLSVGMRIRKSVHEGYKTHKTASGMALPSIQTTLSKSSSTTAGDAYLANYSVKPPREAVPHALQHQRELLPFCGLQKLGGYAEQPVTNMHLYGSSDSDARPVNMFPLPAEAFNQPFLSSTLPPNPNPENPSKRSWHDDSTNNSAATNSLNLNTNFLFALPMKVAEDEAPVSPLSAAVPALSFNSAPQPPLRPFAQPRTRRQPGPRVEVDSTTFSIDISKEADVEVMELDVENTHLSLQSAEHGIPGTPRSTDFEDAAFLRPWAGTEVEMGGM